ncbi:dolichol-phosphate mannosyltransferase [Bosea sp. BE125]|uniref:glycosyltransferase family 2 protein n=1 Tax=Bosea sp. BE125 TaxID=2817909 RepID=UPI002863618C|nr:glycosyltransferase family 2 protein [Bosea sp. BE125]MDR6874170.1 dolichol-phosphate mannosyltransferase [Bosea sp. BE125]
MISVVIPMYNEAESVEVLCDQLRAALSTAPWSWEVVFVNDGSSDETVARLTDQVQRFPDRFRLVDLQRNFGQTAALMAGIDHAKGDIIVPMDGDLQNDPKDIARLVAKIGEGFDVVSGWRRDRQDASFSRVLPSRIANKLISVISGVHLHDYGCSLKAYRCDVLSGFRLYGEMHRFVPIFARWQGAKITEMVVDHHPRKFGTSKYGLERIFKVLLDLLLVKFLTQYDTKPIYVFGGVGAMFFGLSGIGAIYAIWLKLFNNISFIQTPLPLMVMFGAMTGIMCILLGLLAEVLVRIYFESQGKTQYAVRSVIGGHDAARQPGGERTV